MIYKAGNMPAPLPSDKDARRESPPPDGALSTLLLQSGAGATGRVLALQAGRDQLREIARDLASRASRLLAVTALDTGEGGDGVMLRYHFSLGSLVFTLSFSTSDSFPSLAGFFPAAARREAEIATEFELLLEAADEGG